MVSLSMVAIGSQLKSCSLKADNSKMVHCVSESFLAPHIEASIKQNHCPNLLTEAGLIVNIDFLSWSLKISKRNIRTENPKKDAIYPKMVNPT
jgi:hypothetical protein